MTNPTDSASAAPLPEPADAPTSIADGADDADGVDGAAAEQVPRESEIIRRPLPVGSPADNTVPVRRWPATPAPWGPDQWREGSLVLIDKPAGMTSHDVVDHMRRALRTTRVGHAGTLDPEVTGVLPVGVGRATRLLRLLLEAGKTYDTRLHLHGPVDPARTHAALAALVGRITQVPPVRSRVKRVARDRSIYRVDLTSIDGKDNRDVRFVVACEAGTYIRKLCHDLGEALGVGGHMAWLRRTVSSGFAARHAIALADFQSLCEPRRPALTSRTPAAADDARRAALVAATTAVGGQERVGRGILPAERCVLPGVPRIWIYDEVVRFLTSGGPLYLPGVLAASATLTKGQLCAIQTADGTLIALADAECDASAVASSRGPAARPRKVFVRPPWPVDADAATATDLDPDPD